MLTAEQAKKLVTEYKTRTAKELEEEAKEEVERIFVPLIEEAASHGKDYIQYSPDGTENLDNDILFLKNNGYRVYKQSKILTERDTNYRYGQTCLEVIVVDWQNTGSTVK